MVFDIIAAITFLSANKNIERLGLLVIGLYILGLGEVGPLPLTRESCVVCA